jgi:hypothetical protein
MYTLSLHTILFVNDKPREKISQKILENYIRDAYEVLVPKTKLLTDFTVPFDVSDENRLKGMLTLLIDARKTWEEERD